MKGLLYFIITLVVIAGIGSAFWWLIDGSTPQEQLEYLKVTFSEAVDGSAASNTADSASKLGRKMLNKFMNMEQKLNTNSFI